MGIRDVITRLIGRLSRFHRQDDGSVAIVFGLAFVPLVLLAGGAVDYSRAVTARSALSNAADAGALAAVQVAMKELSAGNANWNTDSVARGQKTFTVNARSVTDATVGVPTVTMSQSGAVVSAQLTYTAQVSTNFLKIIGMQQISLSKTVTSSASVPLYTDIHVVIDVSGSMGIGATAADQQTMKTAIGCTIACHYNDIWGETDTRAQARGAGATLRIDVVKQAVANALGQIKSLTASNQVRVALYTFSNTLSNVFPLSSDIAGAITAAGAIDITGDVNQGGTDITYSLSQLNAGLSYPGAGVGQGSPRGMVMLLTDAIQDSVQFIYSNGPSSLMTAQGDSNFVSYFPNRDFAYYTGDPILQTLDPAACAPIKNKGYTILTLDVQYLVPVVQPDASEQRYSYLNQSLTPLIPASMKSCASSTTLSYSANSPTDINAAVAAMFANALGSRLRLTQ